MCIPGEVHRHSQGGCAFLVKMNHKGINTLTWNGDVTH